MNKQIRSCVNAKTMSLAEPFFSMPLDVAGANANPLTDLLVSVQPTEESLVSAQQQLSAGRQHRLQNNDAANRHQAAQQSPTDNYRRAPTIQPDQRQQQQNKQTQRQRRALLRPDDSEVPPEPGAISEQPELSHVHRMQAEMEMHKAAARRGVAFASQSERMSESDQPSKQQQQQQQQRQHRRSTQQRHKSQRRRSSRNKEQQHHQQQRSIDKASSSYSQRSDSGTLSDSDDYYDEDTERGSQSAAAPMSGSASRRPMSDDRRKPSRSVSFNSPNQSGRPSIGTVTAPANEAAATAFPSNDSAAGSVKTATATAKKAAAKSGTVVDKLKQFFSRNVMLIVALVVMLVLVGVGVYMLLRGNREKDKRTREQVASQALLEEEQVQQERDYALEELRQQNAQLQAEQARFANVMQAYEQQNEQFRLQNEAQMEAMEQLVDQNEQYAAAVSQWQHYAAEQERLAALQQQQQQQQQESVEGDTDNDQNYAPIAEAGASQYVNGVPTSDNEASVATGATICAPLDDMLLVVETTGFAAQPMMNAAQSAATFGQLNLSKSKPRLTVVDDQQQQNDGEIIDVAAIETAADSDDMQNSEAIDDAEQEAVDAVENID